MASGDIQQHTRDLLDTLSNSLVLHQTVPYLPVSSLLNLAAASRSFRDLLRHTPGVFRQLDLTHVKTAQFDIDGIDHGGEVWRNVQLDENLTEDDFYSGPLRGIFHNLRRRHILEDVQTLVLDGLSVTAEFCNDILVDPSLRVRILSIREVKNLNEHRLMQSLRYACRPTRPEDMPRLRGLYVFGKKDAPALPAAKAPAKQVAPTTRGAHISSGWNNKSQHALKASIQSEGDDWYQRRGRIIGKPAIAEGWAETLLDCRDVIRFDAVLCTGPRHQNSPAHGKVPVASARTTAEGPWGVATFALGGCASCGSAPEGFTVYGETPAEDLPLLSPIPRHASTIKAATRPNANAGGGAGAGEGKEKHRFVPRCLECIRERYCFSCDQWWCESCYQVPSRDELTAQHVHIVDETSGLMDHELAALEPPKVKTPKITRSCWECEHNCLDCIATTQKRCRACGGGYCIIHYEGSTNTLCDWCSTRGRQFRGWH
ncbi:hypothetical protein F5B20DRAFT_304120 [Whalleya microplaca]|nr:hypothetical protein F5B20DRAFT_304120 [Whalleya microplaca]